MNWKRHFLEGITLVVAAVICATVSNAIAARERKLTVVGTYPNALNVPAQTPDQPVAPVPEPPTTTNVATITSGDGLKPVATSTVALPKPAPSTQHPAPVTKPTKPDIAKFTVHPDKPYIEIAYADVKALHDAGALFLDARRTSVYEQGHIAGARPFSVWESDIDDKVNKLFGERGDPDAQAKPIVVYCSGGECEDSHMLAQKLWGIQFNNVYVYKDGFPDWQAKGGTIHTGANP